MYEIKKCGINPKDYVNHPFSVLSIYKIDEYADACEDARGTILRNKKSIVLCKKCYDFINSLINSRLFSKT